MKTQRITIPKAVLDELNSIIKGELEIVDEDTIATYTANFGDGIEADIKVCGVSTTEEWNKEESCTPYVDAVLFDNGNQCGLLEPEFEQLDGEYIFEYDNEKYQVIVSCP